MALQPLQYNSSRAEDIKKTYGFWFETLSLPLFSFMAEQCSTDLNTSHGLSCV